MDPFANLKRQRELAAEITRTTERLDPPAAVERHAGPLLANLACEAAQLAELVQALDEWRLRGGFDPYGLSKTVHIVAWSDEGQINAQAYLSREAAERDFDHFSGNTIIESSVQS